MTADRPLIRTRDGILQGARCDDGVHAAWQFWGIPYAAAPVGALRWRPPQPPRSWDGVRDAGIPRASAPQAVGRIQMYHEVEQSEDCLLLNVVTPVRDSADGPLPVMVWLHGGAFIHGNGNEQFFNGPRLPGHGVVVVTVNTRLGPLGQLAHSLLTGESPQRASGNYMILDLIAALSWVRDQISLFGGDPRNVTIFGESGGAAKVLALMCTPLAKALFHRAIIQSGGVHGILNGRPLSDNEEEGSALFEELGVAHASDPLAAARALPWQEVMRADAEIVRRQDLLPFRWDATIDGWVLPDSMPRLIETGRAANMVPFIAGCNQGEIDGTGHPMLTYPSMVDYYVSLMRNAAGQGCRSYAYLFDHVPGGWRKDGCIAFHRLEPGYVFGDWDDRYGFFRSDASLLAPVSGAKQEDPELGADDRRVSECMMTLWTSFAETGTPHLPGVDWPAFEARSQPYLFIDTHPHVRTDFSSIVRRK